jgi:hypothetical protein
VFRDIIRLAAWMAAACGCFDRWWQIYRRASDKGASYSMPSRLPFCWWLGVFTRLLFHCSQCSPGVARLSPLRCRITLKDGACSNDY